jgi:hypothetical protein
MPIVRRVLLMTIAASVLVGVAACGNSTPSSTVLLKDAQSAYDSASSVKVAGVVQYKGDNYDVDLALSRSGDLSGTISTSVQQIKLIIVGGTAYQYVSKEFFNQLVQLQKAPASLCAAICNKYLKAPPSGQYAPFTLTSLISQFNSSLPTASSSVTRTTFAGQPAYKLTEPDGSKAYIASRGKHYLLGVAGARQGELTLTEWNTVPAIVAPPASEIADYSGAG